MVYVGTDGSLVTRGDANNVEDDWDSEPITVYGQYQFTIPALGRYLPIGNASGALFRDQEDAGPNGSRSAIGPSTPAPARRRRHRRADAGRRPQPQRGAVATAEPTQAVDPSPSEAPDGASPPRPSTRAHAWTPAPPTHPSPPPSRPRSSTPARPRSRPQREPARGPRRPSSPVPPTRPSPPYSPRASRHRPSSPAPAPGPSRASRPPWSPATTIPRSTARR